MKKIQTFFKNIKFFIGGIPCFITNRSNDYRAQTDGIAIPHIKINAQFEADVKKLRSFFISEKTNIIEDVRMIKKKDEVFLVAKASNVKLSIVFKLKDSVELQLLLGVFLGKRTVMECAGLGFDYNKLINVPNHIELTEPNFIDELLYKALVFIYRDKHPKLTDEELLTVIKNHPEWKENFYNELRMIYT
ncbi:MAG: hypothetical protein JJE44_02155 [Flavobacteriaceae bacterium]|nr:hypothetical protein [Flavobacteriaceae bacterium]